MDDGAKRSAPILSGKRHRAPSAFTPENLLREARRQKGLAASGVPACACSTPTATWFAS
jgi:hypothetical protein